MNELQIMKIAKMEHDIQKAVINGANYLDDRQPGWYTRINLDNLDLWESNCCILGQLFMKEAIQCEYANGYEWAIDHFIEPDPFAGVKLHPKAKAGAIRMERENLLGFNFPHELVEDQALWSMLGEMWIVQIEKRKANSGTMLKGIDDGN
jgi:hypothetical protein